MGIREVAAAPGTVPPGDFSGGCGATVHIQVVGYSKSDPVLKRARGGRQSALQSRFRAT